MNVFSGKYKIINDKNFYKKPSFYTEEEYKKVSERIKDVTVFNMYNPTGICNSRSITSIITFKK